MSSYLAKEENIMSQVNEERTRPSWVEEDTDTFPEMELMDDELDFDDDFDNDDVVEVEPSNSLADVPCWRLIEMSRENRMLQRELADFDDFDYFDGFDGFEGTGNDITRVPAH